MICVTMESNPIYIKKFFHPKRQASTATHDMLMSSMLCIRAERLSTYKCTKQQGFLSLKVYTTEEHCFWKGKQWKVTATTSLEQQVKGL